ncbi:MAG: acetyl-CoA carboxylase, carboxyltransferase subunit beta [Chthonomonas sp.]|nr:acetyl-CoA carboxylase, carboxyltransferase subunit beta [Chthonomonas sp.]
MRAGKTTGNPPASNAFLQCSNCKKTLFRREFEQNLMVCPACDHHHRMSAEQRIEATFDEGTFEELDANLTSIDTLTFPDYAEKLEQAIAKTGRNDGMIAGKADIVGQPCYVALSEFAFMGGSMGSVAGEKVTRTLERAAKDRIPAVIFCTSGGARMQEGLLSLMQMARTTAAAELCRQAGAPFITVFTDPTMAGVLASYASIADVILCEPKALVGFAGARVSKQAQVVKAPDNFQSAEFCLQKGMVDRVVHRRELRDTLGSLAAMLAGGVR